MKRMLNAFSRSEKGPVIFVTRSKGSVYLKEAFLLYIIFVLKNRDWFCMDAMIQISINGKI